MQTHVRIKNTFMDVLLWLRITLSYCVLGALIATLGSAYFQEIHKLLTASVMLLSLLVGVFFAERVRKTQGLHTYKKSLQAQKHLQY